MKNTLRLLAVGLAMLMPPAMAAELEDGLRFYQARQYELALPLLTSAANQGQVEAQFTLGMMYLIGRGAGIDAAQAAQWFKRAADGGDAAAKVSLARLHMQGRGVEKNRPLAMELFESAAAQENTDAQFTLAYMYDNGLGVSKDARVAAGWFGKAANNGHAGAQRYLAEHYLDSDGIARDPVEAYKWIIVAGAGGDREAKESAAGFAGKLGPTEIESGQRRASDWLLAHPVKAAGPR